MEATREIYFNVGGAVLLPMYALAAISIGFMAYGLYTAALAFKVGANANRSSNSTARLIYMAKTALLQLRVISGGAAGLGHALFFWSFLVLTAGTTLVFIQADFTDPIFGYRFLSGGFYKIFSLSLDIAGAVAMIAMGGLLIRRYLFRPEGLQSSWEDALAHGLLFAALATGFMVEGLRMAATELETNMALAYWSPAGLVVAKAVYPLGHDNLLAGHKLMWWGHFLICISFFAAIGYTKLRHIFYIPANYFFTDMGPKGKLATLNLEDENVVQFGAATPSDMTWKELFDSGACVLCKRCQDVCPAHLTDKPLSPMKLVSDIGGALSAGVDIPLAEVVGEDAVWACVTCRACQHVCPAQVEHVGKIVDIRRNLALMEGKFPGDEVAKAMDSIEVNGNPLGMAPAARADWAEGMSLDPQGCDVLYFTGCYACYDSRSQKVAKSFAAILEKLEVKAGILGKVEKCCGEPARKMGNEYLYQTVAAENIEAIAATGVTSIVTTCPHCYHTLNKEYRDMGLDPSIKVEHYTTFLAAHAHRFTKAESQDPVTYHDSCYMGRYSDVYDQPRNLLAVIGSPVVEMERNREASFCCGGGGGRILAEENLGRRINSERATQAAATGAATLAINCPFCMTMMEDGVKTAGLDEKIKPMDLAELLAQRI